MNTSPISLPAGPLSPAAPAAKILSVGNCFAGKDLLVRTDETNVEEIDPALKGELNYCLDLLRLAVGAEEQATQKREVDPSAIEALVESLAKHN